MKGRLLLALALPTLALGSLACGDKFNHQLAHEEKVEQSLAAIDARLSRIEAKITALEGRIATLEQRAAKDGASPKPSP